MEDHQPEPVGSSNNTVESHTAGEDLRDSANIAAVPEDSDHSKVENDVNTLGENDAENNSNKEEHVMSNGGQENGTTIEDEAAAASMNVAKKKKKSKPKSQKAKKLGTGFEEYYVDAPLKPEEHEEEKGLYHSSLPFAQRIENAIQRFAAKRNMDATRKNIFDKYMAQGGIDSGPKMFSGGLDSQTLETGDAKDIALLAATNFVDFDVADPRNGLYEVDFEGCLKSFLSHTVPTTFDLTSEEYIKSIVNVIRNFLNYLLHHDVCPEYAEQITSSKRLCDQGERELWAISQNTLDLPGTFNKACSELYGGVYQGQWATDAPWRIEDEIGATHHGISPSLASQVFKLGIVANTSEEQFKKYEAQNTKKSISITSVDNVSMEVVETIPSNEDVQSLYSIRGELKPIGRLKTKTWDSPFTHQEDLTEDEEIALAKRPKEAEFYEFWLEDEILCNCFPGMKLEVAVTELSIGVSYFDEVYGIYCSFLDISPNALMADWREPEGEDNWLPMREKGGGPLEEGDGEGDLDGEDVEEAAPGNAIQSTEVAAEGDEKPKEGTKEAKKATVEDETEAVVDQIDGSRVA